MLLAKLDVAESNDAPLTAESLAARLDVDASALERVHRTSHWCMRLRYAGRFVLKPFGGPPDNQAISPHPLALLRPIRHLGF